MVFQCDIKISLPKAMASFNAIKQHSSLTCPLCAKSGILSYLQLTQINFEEALNLCLTKGCIFPLNHNVAKYLIKRSSSEYFSNQSEKADENLENSAQHVVPFPPQPIVEVPEPSTEFDLVYDMLNGNNTDNNDNEMTNANDIINEILSQNENSTNAFSKQLNSPTNNSVIEETPVASSNDASIMNEVSNTADINNIDCAEEVSKNVTETDSFIMKNFDENEIPVYKNTNNKNTTKDLNKKNTFSKIDETNKISQSPPITFETDNEINFPLLDKPSRAGIILQWPNKDNSCWLDVILLIITNSVNVRLCLNAAVSKSNVFNEICAVYDECQESFTPSNTTTCGMKLSAVREKLFRLLQTKIKLKRGDFESPVELLPTVLKLSEDLEKICYVKIRRELNCKCGLRKARRMCIPVLSLPNTKSDFHPLKAEFLQPCYKCKTTNQIVSLHLEHLPPLLFFHFQSGVPHTKFTIWDFVVCNVIYSVYAIIQYRVKPYKHFVAWIRDTENNKWIKFDDLGSEICGWQESQPTIPNDEVHFIIWERQGIVDPNEMCNLNLLTNKQECREGNNIPQFVYDESILDDSVDISIDVVHENNSMLTHSEFVGQENMNSQFNVNIRQNATFTNQLQQNEIYDTENEMLPDLISSDTSINNHHKSYLGANNGVRGRKVMKKETVDFISLGKRKKIFKLSESTELKTKRSNIKLQPYKLSKNR